MWDARLFLPALLLACAVGGGAAATADGAPFAQLNATEGEVLAFINGLEGQTVLAGQPQYQHARNLTSSAGGWVVVGWGGVGVGGVGGGARVTR